MKRLVEIRTYKLKPGGGVEFHALCTTRSIPMVRKWGMDVVAFGPSVRHDDEYFLIRAFDNLAHLQASEDAFYGSDGWRSGPREAIMALIESHLDAMLWLSPQTIDGLRDAGGGIDRQSKL